MAESIDLVCPRCNGDLRATFKEVSNQSFIVCRCGDRIRLTSDDGSGHPRGDIAGLESAVTLLKAHTLAAG